MRLNDELNSALLKLDQACYNQEIDLAYTLFVQYIQKSLDMPQPRMLIALLRQRKLPDKALHIAETWDFYQEQKAKQFPFLFVSRIANWEQVGKLDNALELANRAYELFPNHPMIILNAGRINFLTNNLDVASNMLRKAAALDPMVPIWVHRLLPALENRVLELHGIYLSVPEDCVSSAMLLNLAMGRYEVDERQALYASIDKESRVLEIGAGIGYILASAKLHQPSLHYTAIEANPRLVKAIKHSMDLNSINAEIYSGVAGFTAGQSKFYITEDFWSSSVQKIDGYQEQIELPTIDVNKLIAEKNPSVVIMDIEGSEIDLLKQIDLTSIKSLIVEFHPDLLTNDDIGRAISAIINAGFEVDIRNSLGFVYRFYRSNFQIDHTTY